MNILAKSALIATVLFVAACDRNARFDNPADGAGGFNSAGGLMTSGLDASDPTSAYLE